MVAFTKLPPETTSYLKWWLELDEEDRDYLNQFPANVRDSVLEAHSVEDIQRMRRTNSMITYAKPQDAYRTQMNASDYLAVSSAPLLEFDIPRLGLPNDSKYAVSAYDLSGFGVAAYGQTNATAKEILEKMFFKKDLSVRIPIAHMGKAPELGSHHKIASQLKWMGWASIGLGVLGGISEAERELNVGNVDGAIREFGTAAIGVTSAFTIGLASTALAGISGPFSLPIMIAGITAGGALSIAIANVSDDSKDSIEAAIRDARNFVKLDDAQIEKIFGISLQNMSPEEALAHIASHMDEGIAVAGEENIQDILDIGNHVNENPNLGRYIVERPYEQECFTADTQISMWPTVPELQPNTDGHFDQAAVQAHVWKKPIAEIRSGDIVVSFDAKDRLVPGTVGRVYQNKVENILDFFGTGVTPGHVYLCGEGPDQGKFMTLFEIMRRDGTLVTAEGHSIRANSMALVGSEADRPVKFCAIGPQVPGQRDYPIYERRTLRTGHYIFFAKPDNRWLTVQQFLDEEGWEVQEDGSIVTQDGYALEAAVLGDKRLPRPEDYIIAHSGADFSALRASHDAEKAGAFLQEAQSLHVS